MRKVVGGGDKKNSHKGKQKSVQRGKKNTFKIAQKIPAQVDDQTPPPPTPPPPPPQSSFACPHKSLNPLCGDYEIAYFNLFQTRVSRIACNSK